MNIRKPYSVKGVLLSVCAVLLLSLSSISHAQKASFRMQFIGNYIGNRFQQQVMLVKKNKDIIPAEILSLIAEALREGKDHEQRMYLLDIAQTMATMHKHWNQGDENLVVEVETLIKMQIHKEKERQAELVKWKKYEKFIGNFVMKKNEVLMAKDGLTPVIYPHWVHRIWFACKVCHQDIFIMKKGANNLSKDEIIGGKECGVCHNGEVAFSSAEKENCVKCHMAGRPEAEHLYDMENVNHEKIKQIAERLGAQWNYEELPEKHMPLDRFGNIDWLRLKKENIFKPIISLKEDFKDEIRDNKILFESTSPTLRNVLFDHKVHSAWIRCNTCHPSIFTEELGSNDIKMREMATGKFCGHCHGKVSFTFADCLRCHNIAKGENTGEALLRNTKQKK